MILHPGIWALLIGSSVVFLMLLYGAVLGVKIMLGWDYESSSEKQLALERKTYLVSTLVSFAFAFEILATFLFIHTVDDIHNLLIGAMCATGSLNANGVGWYVLYVKIFLFFIAAFWIVLNYIDQRAVDCPLVRLKYGLLLLIFPLAGLDLYLQITYFLGLDPEIITSCCGSLFSSGGESVVSELVGLSIKPAMIIFYGVVLLFVSLAGVCLLSSKALFRYGLTLVSIIAFFVSCAAIISFISLYFYELPTHHCPFDMLQREYNFLGYPIYIGLFLAVFFGALPGLFRPLSTIPTIKGTIKSVEKKWLILAVVSMLFFVGLVSWPIVFGDFILLGYYS